MRALARSRHVLARHPSLYWLAASALALLAGAAVVRSTAGITDARDAWGRSEPVVVAAGPARPGEIVIGEVRRLPLAMIPADALRRLEAGSIARQAVATGEVLVAHDVAAPGGPVALIPRGWQAVAIAEPVASGVSPGDRVGAASGGIVIAPDGLVVGVTEEAVLVAVPADAAAQVAAAAAVGDLALLLSP